MVKIKCKYCEKEFKVDNYRRNTAKYCSKQCYWYDKSPYHEIKKCKQCRKEFKVTEHDKNKKFCSKECLDNFRENQIIKICKQCGKEFNGNINRKFCSRKCYGKNKQIIDIKKCKQCGKEFKTKTQDRNQKFCSRKCYWSFRNSNPNIKIQKNHLTKERIILICKKCGKEFEVHNYRKNTAKYCGYDCLYSSGYNESKFSKNVYKNLKKFFNIEKEKVLKFKERKLIPDFVYNNKIIECFGDYWHCNPNLYENDYWHQYIQKTAEEIRKSDEERVDFLIKKGYDVYILWEYNWNENKIQELNMMKEFLNEICKN